MDIDGVVVATQRAGAGAGHVDVQWDGVGTANPREVVGGLAEYLRRYGEPPFALPDGQPGSGSHAGPPQGGGGTGHGCPAPARRRLVICWRIHATTCAAVGS